MQVTVKCTMADSKVLLFPVNFAHRNSNAGDVAAEKAKPITNTIHQAINVRW